MSGHEWTSLPAADCLRHYRKWTGVTNVPLEPYGSPWLVQPSTSSHAASSAGARAPTEWRALPAGVSRPEEGPPEPSESKRRPRPRPHGPFPRAEEVGFPSCHHQPLTGSSARVFPATHWLEEAHLCMEEFSVISYYWEYNNNKDVQSNFNYILSQQSNH